MDIILSLYGRIEEKKYRNELSYLYEKKNKSINEISKILRIAPQTVFKRMQRLDIISNPGIKKNYLNKRYDVIIPNKHSDNLAEFMGIMLGDGNLSHFQVIVTLGNKELLYAQYVRSLIEKVFKVKSKIAIRKTGYKDVYLGSVEITAWLEKQGLVRNKVKAQVDVPDGYLREKTTWNHFCVDSLIRMVLYTN